MLWWGRVQTGSWPKTREYRLLGFFSPRPKSCDEWESNVLMSRVFKKTREYQFFGSSQPYSSWCGIDSQCRCFQEIYVLVVQLFVECFSLTHKKYKKHPINQRTTLAQWLSWHYHCVWIGARSDHPSLSNLGMLKSFEFGYWRLE